MRKLLLLVFVLVPAILYGWTTPIDISQAPYRSKYVDITCDRYDRIHVVWSDEATGNFDIVYRCCEGSSWGSIVNISNDSTQSHAAKVAIDTAGNPHVIWVDWGTGYVKGEPRYAFYDGMDWQGSINLSDSLPNCSSLGCMDIEVDTLNNIHIVWSDNTIGNFEVYHSIHDGVSWSTPTNISNNLDGSSYCEMAVDTKNHLHVVWVNFGGGGTSDSLEIYYSRYDTIWSSPVNISNIIGLSEDPQISIDPNGYSHVVWRERGSYSYYVFCDTGWSSPHPIAGGWDPVIALDLQNKVHVVYDSLNYLYYIYKDDTLWSERSEVWISPINQVLPALTIDKSNCLRLVWTEAIDGDTSQIYYSKHQLTGIEEELKVESKKLKVKLFQNYPNPFRSFTVIRYSLFEPSHATLKIYDISGRVVYTLVDELLITNYQLLNTAVWNGRNEYGMKVPSGIYFCKLKVKSEKLKVGKTKKMILIR